MVMVFLVGRNWELEHEHFNRGTGGRKKGKGGGRSCRGEGVGWLEGPDDDQPNILLSKMLKNCVATYRLEKSMYRVRGILGCHFPQVPTLLWERLHLRLVPLVLACSSGLDPRSSYSFFILPFSWAFGLGPGQILNDCVTVERLWWSVFIFFICKVELKIFSPGFLGNQTCQ